MARVGDSGAHLEETGERVVGAQDETKWAPLTTESWAMFLLHRDLDRSSDLRQPRGSACLDARNGHQRGLHSEPRPPRSPPKLSGPVIPRLAPIRRPKREPTGAA